MFCMECGTKLPDGAKFCMNCGTRVCKVGETESAVPKSTPIVTPKSTPAAAPRVSTPVYGCSEKAAGMVYVPGKGLYFTADADQKIMFLPEGSKKAGVLVRKGKKYHDYRGLNYWNGMLYVYRDGDEDTGFLKVDPDTGDKHFLEDCRDLYLPPNSRFMVKDGIGYYNDMNGHLCCIHLEEGRLEERPLPDMRTVQVPEAWCTNRCIDISRDDEHNYGERWDGFYLSGECGYVSVRGLSTHTVRFPLENPSVFSYMPVNSCTAYSEHAMISSIGNVVLGNGGDGDILYKTVVGKYAVADEAKPLYSSLPSYQKQYWWRAGKRYIFDNLMLDFEDKKVKKLPVSLKADDFAVCADGSVYLYQKHAAVYHLPANFFEVIHGEDELELYRIWEDD